MRIAMVGSRTFFDLPYTADQYRHLASVLATDGHVIVSGGCLRGGDQYALEGVVQAAHSCCASPGARAQFLYDHLVLHLDHTHQVRDYPEGTRLIRHASWPGLPGYDAATDQLCSAGAIDRGQLLSTAVRPHLYRNAAVAMDSMFIVGWMFGPAPRGTRHTLRCFYIQHGRNAALIRIVNLQSEGPRDQRWVSASALAAYVQLRIEALAALGGSADAHADD